jgi:2-dehydro-3-deoxy-D-arabinonate dehydratase
MKLARVRQFNGEAAIVRIENDSAVPLELSRVPGIRSLNDILCAADPAALVTELTPRGVTFIPLGNGGYLSPVENQEIWAAGVTYKRSKIAREEESAGAAQFYDKVYTAERPELFLKATPQRVVPPGMPIRVRADSKWNVPEPELTLVISKDLRIVGYTIGNDVSSRDIEGENPLYLPQAKVYRGSCSIGPVVVVPKAIPNLRECEIRLVIKRYNKVAFEGTTTIAQMARTPEDLVSWLGRENDFPDGVMLLTGTGIVPPDDFSLSRGDIVDISISGIGTLTNPVA